MSRGHYSLGKRARAADQAAKKRDKAERRMQKREEGPNEIRIASADEVASAPSIEETMAALSQPGASARSAQPVPCRMFVGGLSWDTDEASLRAAFGAYGPVADAIVMVDRSTGRSRGFGFVTMEDRKHAAKAIDALHDSDLDGRTIVVNVATER